MSFQNPNTPKGSYASVVLPADGTAVTLTKAGNYSAIIQVVATGTYTDTNKVAMYRCDGTTPDISAGESGFILGHLDYRVISPGELQTGVNIVTAESGVAGLVLIQYYSNNH